MTDTVEERPGSDLRYVSDDEPGIRRRRRGRGFRYTAPSGGEVPESERKRISDLAVPPAWDDVWICTDPTGHIQATGRDRAGRKQYVYHPEWTRLRGEAKFDRLAGFGRRLPALRLVVAADLAGRALTDRRVTALAVRLLDETLIRVGNRRYAATNGSHGLTTLEARHVDVAGGELRFNFVGKGGAEQEVVLHDAHVARLVRRCLRVGGERLFAVTDDGDGPDSEDVNLYLRSVTGEEYSAKDFRTWGASAAVTSALGRVPPAAGEAPEAVWSAAVDEAADLLGNTRAVCRASYVHPAIEDALRSGRLADLWRRSRRSRWMDRGERTLLRLLSE